MTKLFCGIYKKFYEMLKRKGYDMKFKLHKNDFINNTFLVKYLKD